MSGQSVSLNLFRTADGKQWRCTCPWKHSPPFIFRDPDAEVAGKAMTAHVEVNHKWSVLSIRKVADSTPRPQER